ncbi:PREDICTED: vacuolar protein sorting-associated protein 41 homolog [Thamnophis sirtalis]|uniref:Vacuolar protein sorting-associated protein 41 homolog n=1 Tax=Thamnophis sirtalis TaxID=35019 RepID=A0A6I9X406_9SAUR|nr:PREDICTED: vacuolar protein sorting-associated protein 41 homolog [Thamnophis sirtalis]
MAETAEKEPMSDEETTDESEEDISEEEPKLKYERLSNGVGEIIQKDVASCMTIHEKFLALGTHYGKVYLLDVQGNITQKFDIVSTNYLPYDYCNLKYCVQNNITFILNLFFCETMKLYEEMLVMVKSFYENVTKNHKEMMGLFKDKDVSVEDPQQMVGKD